MSIRRGRSSSSSISSLAAKPGIPASVDRWRFGEPPLPRNHDFIDRDSELHALWQALQPQPGPRRVCVVTGPAGSGKTQLALEYAYRYGHHYDHCLWLNKKDFLDSYSFGSGSHLLILDAAADDAIHDAMNETQISDEKVCRSDRIHDLLAQIPAENVCILLTARAAQAQSDVQLGGLPSEDALRWLQDALPTSWQGWYNAPLLSLYQAVRGLPFPLSVLRRILRHGYRTPAEIWQRVEQQGAGVWLSSEIQRNPALSYCPEEELPLALAVLQ